MPDDRYGEEIAAAIVWHERMGLSLPKMEIELKRKLASEPPSISAYEIPAYIVTIMDLDIPMTSTRKVQRSVLAKQIDMTKLQPILQVVKNDMYEFVLLRPNNKPYMKAAFELFNRCFAPLTIDMKTFMSHVSNGIVILAVDKNDKVDGFVSVLITNLPESTLVETTYAKATGDLTMNTFRSDGDKVVCVAIGSSNYERKADVDYVKKITPPSEKEVSKYLEKNLDYVYKFHTRPKAGLRKGASLIKLMPNARPEDKDSLGYLMLMRYPSLPSGQIMPDASCSIGVQLIEAAMSYARQCGISDVYALSRPAGLREYMIKNNI